MDFEKHLQACPEDMRNSLTYVADTCFMAGLWFKDHEVPFTAQDVLTFAQMVIKHEKASQRP